MRRVVRAIAAMLVTFAASDCSGGASVADSTKEIDHFHQQLDAGQIEAIWDEAGPDLHDSITQEKFITFLSAIHRKLGPLKTSTKTGWNVNYNGSGHFTTIGMQSTFAKGKGDEQFVFKQSGEHQTLVGYHINSMELMIN